MELKDNSNLNAHHAYVVVRNEHGDPVFHRRPKEYRENTPDLVEETRLRGMDR